MCVGKKVDEKNTAETTWLDKHCTASDSAPIC